MELALNKNIRVLLFLALLGIFRTTFAQDRPSSAYGTGLALYQNQKYEEAVPYFWQALRERPNDAMAEYYLACCERLQGHLKEAALHFYLADRKGNSRAIRAYADKIKDRLSLESQSWLDAQLGIPSPPGSMEGMTRALPEGEFRSGAVGFRLSPGIDMAVPGDIDTEMESFNYVAGQYKAYYDGSITTSKESPFALAFLSADLFVALEGLDLGLDYDYYTPSHYSISYSGQGYSDGASFDIDTFALSIDNRIHFKVVPGVRFFLEPQLGLQHLDMDFTIAYQGSSGSPSSASYGYHVDANTLAAGLQLGFQFKAGDHLVFDIAGGYHYSKFTDLSATFQDQSFPYRNGLKGKAVMAYEDYWGRYFVWFMPNDGNKTGYFYNTPGDAVNTRPLVLDLSAVRFSADFAWLF